MSIQTGMRVAIVRGSSLNPWEMQNYEPLAKRQKIVTIGSFTPAYEVSSLSMPIKKLVCVGDVLAYVPFGVKFLYKILGDPQYLVNLSQAISGFDIVHTAETRNYYSYQAIQARERGLVKRVVVTVWETIPFLGDDNAQRKKIKRYVLDNADAFLAVTRAAKDTLVKEGATSSKIYIVPMGVDISKFKIQNEKFKVREKFGIPRDKKVILFVGRLVREKGIYVLLEALDGLKERNDWKLFLVGDGPEKESLKLKVKSAKLDSQVEIIPSISYGHMPEMYNRADIVVLPSIKTKVWEEQFGMVLVEAMACGKAVLTSDGVPREVVGKVGVVVPERDPKLLSEALARLLDSETERKKRGEKGRKRVESLFDAKKISQTIEKLYQELL